MKISFSILIILGLWINTMGQNPEIHYVVLTTFNGKTPVTYDQNYGSLNYSAGTGDLTFTTNLANFKTGSKKIDSLLLEKGQMQFTFLSNLGRDFFAIVREENDHTAHKIMGSVVVNNTYYPTEAYVEVEDFADKSNPGKIILDLKLDIDPKKIFIPYLSNYFNNDIVFQVNDGIIMK
jgi:hypothetical protein